MERKLREILLSKSAHPARAEDIEAITKNKKKAQTDLPNHEIVTLATYLAGGRSDYADTEDIAIKASDSTWAFCLEKVQAANQYRYGTQTFVGCDEARKGRIPDGLRTQRLVAYAGRAKVLQE